MWPTGSRGRFLWSNNKDDSLAPSPSWLWKLFQPPPRPTLKKPRRTGPSTSPGRADIYLDPDGESQPEEILLISSAILRP